MAFCIVPELAAQLKEAAKNGEITMQKLFEMSTEERNSLFGKYADKETAKQINAGFEKAMASSQQTVLNSWVKRTFTASEKKSGKYKDVISKIDELQQQGVLSPKNEKAYLSDLVATKLGATVTADEAKIISEKSAKLQELQSKITGIGDPTDNPRGQADYLKAREEMSNYLASLTPSSNMKVLVGTIGRGMMVATLHSPMLNVISHSVISLPEMIGRRIETRQFQGHNNQFWNQYIKNADQLFNKTGYDISRFETLGGEKKSLGEDYTHSQGSGAVRWTGRLVENTVFKHLHGDLYQRFASRHFADSANLRTTAIAKAEGLTGQEAKTRSLEISKDAALVDPKTAIGRLVRSQAQADALYATFTNKSAVSDAALGIRTLANNATGEFRIGDLTIPFAKVPANALGASLEYAGVNLTAKLALGITKTIAGVLGRESFNPDNFAGTQRTFVRAGLGFTFAYAISQLVKPQDFIGAYPTDPKEQQLLSLQNGVENSIKVGGKWISLNYLANDGAALLGLLYAAKYGAKTPLDYLYRYSQGVSQDLQNTPGLQQMAAVYKYLNTPPKKKDSLDKASVAAGKSVLQTITSRLIPGLVSDIAKMTDTNNRATDKNSIFTTVQSNLPGLREGLPIQHTLFGDVSKTEPWLSTLFFGARVKSANDSQLLNELVNLHEQGALPAITDVSKTSSAAKALQSQIGDTKFQQAMTDFGKQMKQDFIDTINTQDYKDMTAPERQVALDKIKMVDFKQMLDYYGYEKPVKP